MERPPHNDERQDESGQIIRFPTRWVPLDGIQPLDEGLLGPDRSTGVATCEPDAADDRAPVSEAGDFWAGGDMQEFVATSGGPSTESSVLQQEVASVAARGRAAGHRRTALISAAALALVVVVVGALAFEDHGLTGRHPLASSSASRGNGASTADGHRADAHEAHRRPERLALKNTCAPRAHGHTRPQGAQPCRSAQRTDDSCRKGADAKLVLPDEVRSDADHDVFRLSLKRRHKRREQCSNRPQFLVWHRRVRV